MNHIIYCPVCHQRLFDIKPPIAGTIEIKCLRCKKVQHIHLIEPATLKSTTEKTT
ncbi:MULTISPECIES: hypothetical protein [Hungatella]|uniref:hypothetical protein n=1 Tax=Hungatella TaxID=1649459 RepID=UPI00258C1808|nr:hypothetical protein [Hungatella sp.]MCI6451020.1 hypothetical protein [Hungatella sp.]